MGQALSAFKASGWSRSDSPFHSGERFVHGRLGVQDIEGWARKVVRDHLPEEHRAFYGALPFLVAAARDGEGRPWATLLAGEDGFVSSPDPRSLVIDANPPAGDALEGALRPGGDLGILGIELAARRRNRVNGRILDRADGALVFAVEQTFGNCPQYIRDRRWRRVAPGTAGAAVRRSRLSRSQRAWVTAADTFFIASGHRAAGESPTYGMDASHRGGDPGFVQVIGQSRLVFPDYAGNNHFNTIGNLVVDPRAGLTFVDFVHGSLLQLTGRATIDWDSEAVARVPGARRLVIFDIEEVVELSAALPLRWEAGGESVRELRLIDKVPESDDVTSFVFEARDGGPLPQFDAGQHLPIELDVPGLDRPVRRTYSLSGAPSDRRYRISVKREPRGIASRHLHDRLEPGAMLVAGKPAGDFGLSGHDGPIVLVSAGVGVTPMVSMLHDLVAAGCQRPVWFVHAVRDGKHHPFAREVRALAARCPQVRVHTAYSRPRPGDLADGDGHSAGRIDGGRLADLVADHDAHYLLCGPVGFMADVQNGLERRGVSADRIHAESFGPVG